MTCQKKKRLWQPECRPSLFDSLWTSHHLCRLSYPCPCLCPYHHLSFLTAGNLLQNRVENPSHSSAKQSHPSKKNPKDTLDEQTSTKVNSKLTYPWWFKVTFLGWLSDPFKGLSDLQLGDEKVTLNHLVHIIFFGTQTYLPTYPNLQLDLPGLKR